MIIEATGLTKRFGKFTAIESVSFAVEKGEIVGFIGANGAGKTTTIAMLLGFIEPTEGQVKVFDELIAPPTAHMVHQKIGYAAGDMQLPDSLTGKQYLEFISHQYRSVTAERRAALVTRFQPQLTKKIKSLSRGNKQKIALIAAFLPSPELVVLDEPTSGLDPLMQERFLELIREEQTRGATVFMSSHYLTEVADVCSRVILMRDGKIIEDLPADELFERSGKHITVVSSDLALEPPDAALGSKTTHDGDSNVLQFVWNGEIGPLVQWISDIDGLNDVEIGEHNLDAAFKQLYVNEETTKS